MRTLLTTPLACLVVLLPAMSAGQGTEPTAQHMVRAAGMPLDDGTLPPGTLVVRLVEGAFTRDLAGQTVDVLLGDGRRESALTGPDGRARFDRLPAGDRVQVTATVGDEGLESESFTMPGQGGVRVLLVTGDGTATPAAHATSTASAWSPLPASSLAPARDGETTDPDTGVAVIRAVLATATMSAFAMMLFARRSRRTSR